MIEQHSRQVAFVYVQHGDRPYHGKIATLHVHIEPNVVVPLHTMKRAEIGRQGHFADLAIEIENGLVIGGFGGERHFNNLSEYCLIEFVFPVPNCV